MFENLARLRAKHTPVLRNVLKAAHGDRALLVYLKAPFLKAQSTRHTNGQEVLELAAALDAAGFRVDATNYDHQGRLDFRPYQAVVGLGLPFVELFRQPPDPMPRTLFYSTGIHNHVQNLRTLQRVEEVRRKRGPLLLESGRFTPWDVTSLAVLADATIALGNETSADTFRVRTGKPVHSLPLFFHPVLDGASICRRRDPLAARSHFLWFGSTGFIHKGLDLALEAFAQRPELHLHVCGPMKGEAAFQRCYARELALPNVHNHGFVDLRSSAFAELMATCAYTLLPSCSEGGAGSVVAAAGNGALLPVVSPETGLDLPSLAPVISTLTVAGVLEAVDAASRWGSQELQEASLAWHRDVLERHGQEVYRARLRRLVAEVLRG